MALSIGFLQCSLITQRRIHQAHAKTSSIRSAVFTAQRYASAVYAVVVCVWLSVCLSVTIRYCTSG